MKVALVQDWLTELGGAEKVFKCFLELYPEADVYTITSHKRVIDKLNIDKERLHESFISRLPFGRSKYRNYLPLFAKAIESFDFSNYDIVISSSSSVAKGVMTNANQLHICYCHSPVRYAWDLYHHYLNDAKLDGFGIKRWYIRHVLHKLRIWDIISANRVDYFIANSNYIKRRINKVYRSNSHVIYPPVDMLNHIIKTEKKDYYFAASRLVPYKKMGLIAKAFAEMPDKKLIIAGMGPEYRKLRHISGSNVELQGYVTDEEMIELMQNAKAFVFAANEDFGIIPVEAQACGTPVIALGHGGTKETVIDGETGVHFDEQIIESLIDAIKKFEGLKFDALKIRKNAEKFSKERFCEEIRLFVDEKYKELLESGI